MDCCDSHDQKPDQASVAAAKSPAGSSAKWIFGLIIAGLLIFLIAKVL